MAKTIPQLTDATTVNAADELIIQQGGITKRATGAELAKGLNAINGTVNVKDFGAVGDGATDDTAAIQAAINAATNGYAGKAVIIPAGVYKTTAPLTITRGCSLIGDAPIGFDASRNQAGGFPTVPSIAGGIAIGGGTWLFLSHTGKGVVLDGSASSFGNCVIRGLGTFRNQPAPATSYAPTNHDWDFSLEFVQDVTMQDIVLLNATKGIYASQAGRFNFYNITGQPLQAGILINESYGVVKIDNVLFNATVWKNDVNVHTYMRNNLVALEMRRSDNPQISNFFSIFPRIGILFGYNATAVLGSGYTSRACLTNIGIDGTGEYSIKFDADADNTTASITNFYVFGRAGSLVNGTPTIPGPNGFDANTGILCEADNVYVALTNFKASYFGKHVIKINGANSRIVASDLVIDNYNTDNGSHAALHAESTNKMFVANKIVSFGTNNNGPIVNDASRVQTSEWLTFTPTVTSTSGTITTASASLRYKVENDHVEYYGEATITTNGTGAGAVQLTIPINNASSTCGFAGYGRSCITSGDTTSVRVFTNKINITTYNNAYPATDTTSLIFGGVYRI